MDDERTRVIREPVHGDIALNAAEMALLDTPGVQRLRGIRQLGTAHLVFPGATHTRFEHSLGVLHMAGLLAAAVRAAGGGAAAALDGEAVDHLRLAALVHDVAHVPFGHTLEDQAGLFGRHDTSMRIQEALDRGGAGALLDARGARSGVLGALGLAPAPPCRAQLLAGAIGADILDYLARDSHATGLALRFDPRIVGLFRVEAGTGRLYVDVEKRGMLREDALSEVLRVLEARYYFAERVYHHHAKAAADALVARAVEEALAAGTLGAAALARHTDESLLAELAARGPEPAARLAVRLRERRLPKRFAVYPRYLNREVQDALAARFRSLEARRALEAEVAAAVRRRTGRETEVLLFCPAREMQLKEAAILVRLPGEEGLLPLSACAGRVPRVAELEESYRNLWKLYLFAGDPEPRALAAAADAAAALLPEARNAYALPSR